MGARLLLLWLSVQLCRPARGSLAVEPDTWSCPSFDTRLALDEEQGSWAATVEDLACSAVKAGTPGHPAASEALSLVQGRDNSTETQAYRTLLEVLEKDGARGLERERALIERAQLEAEMVGDIHPHHFWKVAVRAGVLRRLTCEIPNLVHFIKADSDKKRFLIQHFLSVKSAVVFLRPDVVYFYSTVQPEGYWWDKIKAHVTLVLTWTPSHIGTKPLYYAAHQSDVMRFQILLLKGGIYMDWDVIALRPFTPLLQLGASMLVGEEKRVPGYAYSLSNAVMIARPRAPFLRQWLKDLPHVFNPECYTCHSVGYAPKLAARMPDQVKVLPWKSFCYPGWEKEPVDNMFRENAPVDEELGKGYAIHLFESHANMVPHMKHLSEEYIRTTDSNFNRLVRPLLEDDYTGEGTYYNQ